MTIPTSPAAPAPAPPAPFASVTTAELTVGGLVRKTFAVWWRNALRFAALSLIVWAFIAAVLMALWLAVSGGHLRPSSTWPVLALPAMTLVIGLLLVVQMGALTHGALQHLADRPVRFGAMLGAGLRRALPVVATGFLAYWTVAVGLVLLVVPGIFVATALSVAVPAVVVERIGPMQALRRSWELTRDHRLTVFLAALVLAVVVFGANAGGQAATALLGPAGLLLALPLQVLVLSLPVLLPAVAYHDLRVQKEGIDTSELAKVFE